ncbi:hypothetical protein V8E36_004092 [Tilletia maclaganii]
MAPKRAKKTTTRGSQAEQQAPLAIQGSGSPSTSDGNTEHALLSELLENGAPDAESQQHRDGAGDGAEQAGEGQEENQDRESEGGRRGRGLNWRGGEIRALVIAIDAHGVFDPNKTSAERQAAWVPVATDVNRWAEQAEGVVCADRSALACQTQWRKTVYKKLKEGMRMSEIATGPSEKTDEEWQPILAGLAV